VAILTWAAFNTARLQASAAKLLMARAAFVALVIVTLTLFTLQDDVQTARSVTFVGTRIRWNIARGHTARLEPWSLAPTPREPGASRSLRLTPWRGILRDSAEISPRGLCPAAG